MFRGDQTPTVQYIISQRDAEEFFERLKAELRPLPPPPPLMKLPHAAKQLGVSLRHIKRKVGRGEWPHYRDGRVVLVDVQEIRALLRVEVKSPISLNSI